MIGTIAGVIRGEGLPSAISRTNERIGDTVHHAMLRARAPFSGAADAAILNVAASGAATRLGGVQVQLKTRLDAERQFRNVALLTPGVLDLSQPRRHQRTVSNDLATGIREAIAVTGARTVHFEGMSDIPFAVAMQLIESGIDVIISVHDFSLFCPRPHLLEEPMGRFCDYSEDLDRCHRCLHQSWDVSRDHQRGRRALARQLLTSARAVISPSRFLLDQHRKLFSLPRLAGEVIEPGIPAVHVRASERKSIAFAGSAKRHKGAHLLPELRTEMHIFGSGDEDLLRRLRRDPNFHVHGYYRSGTLPSLLARHDVGLVVIPSTWPEAHCLVLSEAWLTGAAVVAFDLGAQADRIRQHGGGWLAPIESGAEGLAEIVADWKSGKIATTVPSMIATPMDAAQAHLDLYRRSS